MTYTKKGFEYDKKYGPMISLYTVVSHYRTSVAPRGNEIRSKLKYLGMSVGMLDTKAYSFDVRAAAS